MTVVLHFYRIHKLCNLTHFTRITADGFIEMTLNAKIRG